MALSPPEACVGDSKILIVYTSPFWSYDVWAYMVYRDDHVSAEHTHIKTTLPALPPPLHDPNPWLFLSGHARPGCVR